MLQFQNCMNIMNNHKTPKKYVLANDVSVCTWLIMGALDNRLLKYRLVLFCF